ncbi:MFS transporter [Streptomyces tremellae]|uniref:MFS transporter n=1 Tax=Streptomyces tremellae TaxID=1124239 RepID=A0ABP7F5H1_9ACTN
MVRTQVDGERRKGSAPARRFRLRWAMLGAASVVLVLNYADRSALGVAGPTMMRELHISNSQFGVITAVFFVGYAPFCFIGGHFADRYGPRRVMAYAAGLWSVCVALTGVAAGFISLLVVRFGFGFGEGPQGAVTTKLASNWFPQREMGRAVGVAQAGTPLGGAIGTPVVAGLIAWTGDWRIPFVILGVLGGLVTLGWWVVVRDSPDFHPLASARDSADIAAGRIAPAEGEAGNGEDGGEAPAVRTLVRRPLVLAVAVAFFGYSWVLYTFLSWFPVYLTDEQGVDIKSIALAGAVPWIFGVVGYLSGGTLADRLAERTGEPRRARAVVIVAGLVVTAALLCSTSLVSSAWAAVALMSAVVFMLYLTGGQYFVIVTDTVPRSRVGSVTGFVHFVANLSGIFAPLLVGLLIDSTGSWNLTFGVSAAVALAGAATLAVPGLRPDRARAARKTR